MEGNMRLTVTVKSSRHTPPSSSLAVSPVPWIENVSKSVQSRGLILHTYDPVSFISQSWLQNFPSVYKSIQHMSHWQIPALDEASRHRCSISGWCMTPLYHLLWMRESRGSGWNFKIRQMVFKQFLITEWGNKSLHPHTYCNCRTWM